MGKWYVLVFFGYWNIGGEGINKCECGFRESKFGELMLLFGICGLIVESFFMMNKFGNFVGDDVSGYYGLVGRFLFWLVFFCFDGRVWV